MTDRERFGRHVGEVRRIEPFLPDGMSLIEETGKS
jgi:hypothetical protein